MENITFCKSYKYKNNYFETYQEAKLAKIADAHNVTIIKLVKDNFKTLNISLTDYCNNRDEEMFKNLPKLYPKMYETNSLSEIEIQLNDYYFSGDKVIVMMVDANFNRLIKRIIHTIKKRTSLNAEQRRKRNIRVTRNWMKQKL